MRENKEDYEARLARDTWVMAATTIDHRDSPVEQRAFVCIALRGRNAVQAVLFPPPT